MKRIVVFISLLVAVSLVLAGCGGTSKAANHLDAIKQAGTIKVGTSADYPPFESVDESGNKVGFDIELMTEIAKRLGVKLEWVDMPFDSLIAAVQEGKIDASISAFNYSEERDQMIDFSEAYFTSEDAFTVAEGFTGSIVDPQDVAAFNVGVQNGTTQDDWLTNTLVADGALPEENLFRYDRVDQAMLDSLAKGAWNLRIRDDGSQQRICVRDGREFIQLRHRQPGCSRFIVQDGAEEVVVQYTCRGNGYGRTSIRREGNVLPSTKGTL